MDDAEKPQDTLEDFSFDDFIAFSKDKGVTETCPTCNARNWNVVVELDDGQIPSYVARNYPGLLSKASTLAVVLNECLNCGYLRSFNRVTLARWKKQKIAFDKGLGNG